MRNWLKKIFSRKWFAQLKEKAIHIVTSPWRAFKFICFSLGFVTFSFLMVCLIYLYTFFNSMPDFGELKFKGVKKIAIAKVQKKFEVKKKMKRYRWTPVSKMSRHLMFAIVMSEDGDYFQHGGVDYNAIIDSMAVNLKNRQYTSGASTITQQVVKNIFLTNEKSLIRKAKEILISLSLERAFTKNQILELYLNIIEVGPDLFGVNMASSHYFRKKPSKINGAEGVYMALMLPSPRRYYHSIHKNKYLSKKHKLKMKRVLGDMLYKEYISPKQYKSYLNYRFH